MNFALLVIDNTKKKDVEKMGVRFIEYEQKVRDGSPYGWGPVQEPDEGEVHPEDFEDYEDWFIQRGGELERRTEGIYGVGNDDGKTFYFVPFSKKDILEAVFPEFQEKIQKVGEAELKRYPWDYDWRRDQKHPADRAQGEART